MLAALPKRVADVLKRLHPSLRAAKQIHASHADRLSVGMLLPSASKSFSSSPELLTRAAQQNPASRRANIDLHRSFAASALRAASSTSVLAGTVAGARSMFADASIGSALATSAAVIAGMNTVGFAITALTKSHKITDLTGTTAFIGSAWATHAIHCHAAGLSLLQPSKSLLLAGMVTLWGVRLAGFLFHRVLQTGKDARLDDFFPKDKEEPLLTGDSKFPLKLAGFWTLQGLWAWIVCLPVTVAHASAAGTVMGPVAWVGAAAWALGFGWEALADQQKSSFKKDPNNKGKFMESGLFAYSRHPNYFGEILAWTGLWLTAGFPALWLQYPWIAASPGFTAVLLLYVSGVPITEKNQQERYGSDPKYKEYKATTNLLIPGPKHATKNQ